MNRHRGVSGADNFFAVCDDVSPVASSVIFAADTSAQIAETELSSVESTTSFECDDVFIMSVFVRWLPRWKFFFWLGCDEAGGGEDSDVAVDDAIARRGARGCVRTIIVMTSSSPSFSVILVVVGCEWRRDRRREDES